MLQISKWFLEKRAIDAENFPELPSAEEGGSNAIVETPVEDKKGSTARGFGATRTLKGSTDAGKNTLSRTSMAATTNGV